LTLIFAIADEPLHAHMFKAKPKRSASGTALWPGATDPARTNREFPPGVGRLRSTRCAAAASPALDGQVALEVPMVRVEEEFAPCDIGLIWIDAEEYEPHVLDGLAGLLSRSVPLALEFTPSRYSSEKKQRLVARLAAHYSSFQSLGRRDAGGPISGIA
jgi:hypothetical protein